MKESENRKRIRRAKSRSEQLPTWLHHARDGNSRHCTSIMHDYSHLSHERLQLNNHFNTFFINYAEQIASFFVMLRYLMSENPDQRPNAMKNCQVDHSLLHCGRDRLSYDKSKFTKSSMIIV